jgi:hypothetical protein
LTFPGKIRFPDELVAFSIFIDNPCLMIVKMKLNNYLLVGFILLILFNLVLLYRYNALINDKKRQEYISTTDQTDEALKRFYYESLNSGNCSLNLKEKLVSIGRDTLTLGDILKQDSKYLLFRYSNSNCNSCINEAYDRLIRRKDQLQGIHIIVLSYYESIREMIIEGGHSSGNKLPVYLCAGDNIGLPIDEKNVPYLCFVDDGKISKHVMVVDSSYPDIIDEYLKIIINKYCE